MSWSWVVLRLYDGDVMCSIVGAEEDVNDIGNEFEVEIKKSVRSE